METSGQTTRGARTSSSWAVPCWAVNSTGYQVLTEPFFQHLQPMGPMLLTTELMQEAAAYRSLRSTSTVLPSPPGLASGTQTWRRCFPTLEDLANPTSDSLPSFWKKRGTKDRIVVLEPQA